MVSYLPYTLSVPYIYFSWVRSSAVTEPWLRKNCFFYILYWIFQFQVINSQGRFNYFWSMNFFSLLNSAWWLAIWSKYFHLVINCLRKCEWTDTKVTIYRWNFQSHSILKYLYIIDLWLPFFVYYFLKQSIISSFF